MKWLRLAILPVIVFFQPSVASSVLSPATISHRGAATIHHKLLRALELEPHALPELCERRRDLLRHLSTTGGARAVVEVATALTARARSALDRECNGTPLERIFTGRADIVAIGSTPVEDGAAPAPIQHMITLETNRSLALVTDGLCRFQPTSHSVSVHGIIMDGDTFVLACPADGLGQPIAQEERRRRLVGTSGTQSIVVVPLVPSSYGGSAAAAYSYLSSDTDVEAYVNDLWAQAAAVFDANSWGALTLDVTVTPPLSLETSYEGGVGCTTEFGVSAVTSEARSLAAAANYNFDNYDYYYLMFPNDACTFTLAWAGLGVLGGAGAWAQLYGQPWDLRVSVHELGHNLGAHHASWSDSTSWYGSQYGNPYSVMGDADDTEKAHFLGVGKSFFGWLPSEHVVSLAHSENANCRHCSSSWSGDLHAIDTVSPTSAALLKIYTPTASRFYFAEYRAQFGAPSLVLYWAPIFEANGWYGYTELVEASTVSTALSLGQSFVLDLETVGAVVSVHSHATDPADALRVSVSFVEIGSRAYDSLVDHELQCCRVDTEIAFNQTSNVTASLIVRLLPSDVALLDPTIVMLTVECAEVDGLWLHLHEAFPLGYASYGASPEIGAFASAMIPTCADSNATPLRVNTTLTYHGTAGEIWRGYSSANYIVLRSSEPVPESTVVRISFKAASLDNGYCGENRYSHIGQCDDTSGEATNVYDRACIYTGFPGGYGTYAYCAQYDDVDFTATDMCCACGGGSLGSDVCLSCPGATVAPSGSESVRACASCLDYRFYNPLTKRCVACPEFAYVPEPGMTGTNWLDVCLYCDGDEVLMQLEMINNRSCYELYIDTGYTESTGVYVEVGGKLSTVGQPVADAGDDFSAYDLVYELSDATADQSWFLWKSTTSWGLGVGSLNCDAFCASSCGQSDVRFVVEECAWSPAAPSSITCLNDGFNGNNVTISRGSERVAEHTLLRSDYKLSDYFCLKANTEHTLRAGNSDGRYLELIHWSLFACQEETVFLSGGAELEGARFRTPDACSVLSAPVMPPTRLINEFSLEVSDFIASFVWFGLTVLLVAVVARRRSMPFCSQWGMRRLCFVALSIFNTVTDCAMAHLMRRNGLDGMFYATLIPILLTFVIHVALIGHVLYSRREQFDYAWCTSNWCIVFAILVLTIPALDGLAIALPWHCVESEHGFPSKLMHQCSMIRGVLQDAPLFIIVLIAYQVSEGATALAVLGSMASFLSISVLAARFRHARGLAEKTTTDRSDATSRSDKDDVEIDVTLDDPDPLVSESEWKQDNAQLRQLPGMTPIDPLGRKQPALLAAAPPEAPALELTTLEPGANITCAPELATAPPEAPALELTTLEPGANINCEPELATAPPEAPALELTTLEPGANITRAPEPESASDIAPTSPGSLQLCARWDFVAQEEGDLAFAVGELITVDAGAFANPENGWVHGAIGERAGSFPRAYAEKVATGEGDEGT